MGIQGLLSFLEKASHPVNISQFSGCTVAIDSYCWLHKGAFSCAEKLARGEKTDQYVLFCMKFVNMLLSHNIKPILVFDGRHLPAKAETEKKRRELRESNRKKAAELLRLERVSEARSLIQRCIDVTHEMALALMKECRSQGVDCIVAPYEADAQLAFLNLNGFAHLVITEDSDLMLFGCKLVLFKMDVYGNGVLVEQSKIPLAMKLHPNQFSMEKFRHMCILSGCDYLKSLPGIGLAKACKFFKKTQDDNVSRALTRLGAYLNMPNLEVSEDYREKFLEADAMFLYQPVFDPRTRRVVPLNPLPPDTINPLPCTFDPERAYQLALGNLNPFTLQQVDSWDPDQPQTIRTKSWKSPAHRHKSIWSKDYQFPKPLPAKPDPREVTHPTTKGKTLTQPVSTLSQRISELPKKNVESELARLRECFTPPTKRQCLEESDSGLGTDSSSEAANSQEEQASSSSLSLHFQTQEEEKGGEEDKWTVDDIFGSSQKSGGQGRNPFQSKQQARQAPGGALDTFSRLRKAQVEAACVVQSRYFSPEAVKEPKNTPQKSTSNKEESDVSEALLEIINATPSPKRRNSLPLKRNSLISPKKNLFEVISMEEYEKKKEELASQKCLSPDVSSPRKNIFSVTKSPKAASPKEIQTTPNKNLFSVTSVDDIQGDGILTSPKQQSFLKILDEVSRENKEGNNETVEQKNKGRGMSGAFKWSQPLLDNPRKGGPGPANSLIGLYKPKPKGPVLSSKSPKAGVKKSFMSSSPKVKKPSLPENANFKQKPAPSTGQASLLNMFAFQAKPKLKTT